MVHVGFVRLASEDVEVTLVFAQRLAICDPLRRWWG